MDSDRFGANAGMDDAALEIADLLNELILDDGEVEVAYRDGWRYVNRLHRTTPDEFRCANRMRFSPTAASCPTGWRSTKRVS
ncbi:MAG: hypothetical protein R2838_23110 [Caldilineaceae bacterium]